jgi:hypothetical protein
MDIVGGLWTTGSASATGYGVVGYALSHTAGSSSVVTNVSSTPLFAMATGAYSGTPNTTRVISLVAPVVLVRDVEAPWAPGTTLDERIPGIARLTLTVPEPGRTTLHLAAVGALLAAGRWRRRKI